MYISKKRLFIIVAIFLLGIGFFVFESNNKPKVPCTYEGDIDKYLECS